MGYVKVYTREVDGKRYPEELAYSVHFSVSRDGISFEPVNRNYGILFARADEKEDGTLSVKELADPVIFRFDGGFGITARRLGKGAMPDLSSEGKLLYWTSRNLIDFDFNGLQETCDIEGYPDRPSSTVEAEDDILLAMSYAWSPYPSGETAKESTYGFPLAKGYADPVLFHWRGAWHFIATNDNNGNIGFRVRRAKRFPDLFTPGVNEHLILDRDDEKGFVQTFWAPEFHEIGGRLYLLFAVSGVEWGPQCYMMRLKEDGEIICREDWETPVRVSRRDGSTLVADGITLDMTHVQASGRSYLVWSQRRGIGSTKDSGSMLYIAQADPDRPWCLASDPVLLSRPLQGWENQSGTINNEGPYPLYYDGMIHLAFSGGDARGFAYSIGFLSIGDEADLLDPTVWKKCTTPALTSFCLEEQYGPGHNSFFEDDEGRTWIAYHAEEYPDRPSACAAIRRVYFDEAGRPRLDFTTTGTRDIIKKRSV
jgi:GH43 family beta-xylosidase